MKMDVAAGAVDNVCPLHWSSEFFYISLGPSAAQTSLLRLATLSCWAIVWRRVCVTSVSYKVRRLP